MVYMLSTIHVVESTSGLTTVSRRGEDGIREDVPCPPAVIDYISFMRGVDRGDQLIELYNAGKKSHKWWKRIFFHILECSILNFHTIYKSSITQGASNVHDLLHFRIQLAEQLVGGKSFRRKPGTPSVSREERLNTSLGHLSEVVSTPLQFVVCSEVGIQQKLPRSEYRHRISIMCSYCRVYLCVHKSRNYFFKCHKFHNYCSSKV